MRKLYKNILTTCLAAFALTLSAPRANAVVVDDVKSMQDVVNILNKIEGYVFIEKGDDKERDLAEVFGKTDAVLKDKTREDLMKMHWDVFNENVVDIKEDDGTVVGLNYGQSIVKLTDEKDKSLEFYFIVFVCPTITVVSPDGAVYTHQNVYGQKVKVDFSHSKNFSINCVMAEYNGNVYDITKTVVKDNGHFESSIDLESDMTFTVTLQEFDEDKITGDSPIRLRVANGTLQFDFVDENYNWDNYLSMCTLKISTLEGKSVTESMRTCVSYNGETPYPIYHNILNEGIYLVTITDPEGTSYKYKIVIKK